MKKNITIFSVLLISVTLFAQNEHWETKHFKVTYSPEAEEYANASLKILEAVWTIATDNGYYLPDRLKFTIRESDRNVLYFDRKSRKGITWEYKSLTEFLPPDQGGKNCIYGLCHEMGHLCMHNTNHNRNSWMSLNYREGWADYFGNMLVDSLYEEPGTDIWPEPHDFRKYAGMDYFLKRLEEDNPTLQSFNSAGQFWYELGSEIGFGTFQLFFNSVKANKVENAGAKEKFSKVLQDFIKNQESEAWFDQFADNLIIDK